jgi:hypothetical protein
LGRNSPNGLDVLPKDQGVDFDRGKRAIVLRVVAPLANETSRGVLGEAIKDTALEEAGSPFVYALQRSTASGATRLRG